MSEEVSQLRQKLLNDNQIARRLLTEERYLESLQLYHDELSRLVGSDHTDQPNDELFRICLRIAGMVVPDDYENEVQPDVLNALVHYPQYLERIKENEKRLLGEKLHQVGGSGTITKEQVETGRVTLNLLEVELRKRKEAASNLTNFEDLFIKELNYCQDIDTNWDGIDISSERQRLTLLVESIQKTL